MSSEIDIPSYLKDNLETDFIGRELHYLESTTSTQDIARELADEGTPEGTVVIAVAQRTGRGRLGRSWLSPVGGLATSIVLRPSLSSVRLLPAISSVAVYRTLKNLGVQSIIKWPNDVLIKERKVCGILIEHGLVSGKLSYSIVGIGINVNFDTTLYPEIADIATSLSVQLGREVQVGTVALHLYTELEHLYNGMGNPDPIIREWVNAMGTIGQRITVDFCGNKVEGIAEAVNSQGNLVLRLDDGSALEVIAGDVIANKVAGSDVNRINTAGFRKRV